MELDEPVPVIGVGLGERPTLAALAFQGGGGNATVRFNIEDGKALKARQGGIIDSLRAQFLDDAPGSTQSTYVKFSGVHVIQIDNGIEGGATVTLHYDQVERATPVETFNAKIARRAFASAMDASALPYPPE